MIRLQALHVRNFRGIRELDLQLNGSNFAIQGPNGSGKSGVVDAIEFALTGSISRLAGPGTGGLSTQRHGPHVDFRDNAREGRVSLTVILTESGVPATIERSLDRPKDARIDPADAATKAVFERLAEHPEFVLSRREIIKYVLVEPGKRAAAIQSLLRLDRIEELRACFRTAVTNTARAVTASKAAQADAREQLMHTLGVDVATKGSILGAVNALRATAGLQALPELSATLRVDEGAKENNRREGVNKRSAVAALTALRALYSSPAADETLVGEFLSATAELRADPALVDELGREQFLEAGLGYFDGSACPFCDTAWDAAALRELIRRKLERAANGAALRQRLSDLAAQLTSRLQELERPVIALAAAARTLKDGSLAAIDRFAATYGSARGALSSVSAMAAATEDVLVPIIRLDEVSATALAALERTLGALPDDTGAEKARTLLVEAQVRLEAARSGDRRVVSAERVAGRAATVLKVYDKTIEGALNALYEKVEDRFTTYYRVINRDDESAFRAELTRQAGAVDLNVDFYGRGLFPPVAYHSEGHQDGMGLCLYLALMEQVLGADFTFAVLDDVVMSVDSTHRREVCRLLKEHFSSTQLVITTHDLVWLGQMRNAGVVTAKASARFTHWTVTHGPYVAVVKDEWDEIEGALNRNEVPAAAAGLRRHLEAVAFETAERIGAEVPLRTDLAYELGDLLPRVVKRWDHLLGKAVTAAHSWGDDGAKALATAKKVALSEAARTSDVERWALNPAVHYNEWATFARDDFAPVVASFRALEGCLRCGQCGGWLYLEPRIAPKSIRCDCARDSLNLATKPKG